jgi:hypothetical protein
MIQRLIFCWMILLRDAVSRLFVAGKMGVWRKKRSRNRNFPPWFSRAVVAVPGIRNRSSLYFKPLLYSPLCGRKAQRHAADRSCHQSSSLFLPIPVRAALANRRGKLIAGAAAPLRRGTATSSMNLSTSIPPTERRSVMAIAPFVRPDSVPYKESS